MTTNHTDPPATIAAASNLANLGNSVYDAARRRSAKAVAQSTWPVWLLPAGDDEGFCTQKL